MLKTLLKLQLTQFVTSLTRKTSKGVTKPRSRVGMILIGLLLLYCAVVFLGMFAAFFMGLGTLVAGGENAWIYFALLALLVFLIDFVFTIFTAKSQLFEAADNEALLSLPIRPRDILLSRMLMILLTDYLFGLLVALPAIVVWCLLGQASPLSILFFLVGVACMPGLSLALSCFVGWLLSLLTAHMKNPALVTTLLGCGIFVLYLFGCMKLGEGVYITEEMTLEIARGMRGALFFPFRAFGVAVAEGRPLWLLAYLACMLLPFALLLFVLSKTFLPLATRKRGSAVGVYRSTAVRAGSSRSALIRNEFRRLTGSSAYMLNGGMGILFTLLVGVGIFFFPVEEGVAAGIPTDLMAAVVAALLAFLAGMTLFSASALSLEGRNIALLRSLPLSGRTILFSKLIPHLSLAIPVTLFASVTSAIVIRPALPTLLALLLVPPLYQLAIALVGLLMNLALPRFEWSDETSVVKQSGAVSLTMLIGTLGSMLAMAPGIVLGICLRSPALGILLAGVIPLGASIGMLLYLFRHGDRAFSSLG